LFGRAEVLSLPNKLRQVAVPPDTNALLEVPDVLPFTPDASTCLAVPQINWQTTVGCGLPNQACADRPQRDCP
jgi:hypothetical protein